MPPSPGSGHSPLQELKLYEDAAVSCNRCGFCTSYCPTYLATGDEASSPRGRNQLFRAITEGKLANPADARRSIDTCLLCGECTSVCFAEVPTAKLMVLARGYLNVTGAAPRGVRLFISQVLKRPAVFRRLLRAAFIGKRFGLAWLAARVGLLDRFLPALAAGNRLVDWVPLRFGDELPQVKPYLARTLAREVASALSAQSRVEDLERRGKPVPTALAGRARRPLRRPNVALMPVCGSRYLNPAGTDGTAYLLERLGLDFVIPELLCCGLPAASYGILDQVRDFARENIQRLEAGGFEDIIIDDASCSAHVRDYPQYFHAEPEWMARAHGIAQKTRDLSVFLLDRGLSEVLRRARWTGGLVAYHDPCKAQYGQKLTAPPRELLRAVPGLTLVTIPEADQCCGGGGTFSLAHPDLSRQVLEAKIANIVASGAALVVTSATSCLAQIGAGLRGLPKPIPIVSLSEFLADVLRAK